jgi:hypothetical protein
MNFTTEELIQALAAKDAENKMLRGALEAVLRWGASVKKLEEAVGLDTALLLCSAALAPRQEKP